ncbi:MULTISPECIES: peroxide stress protein YaaA [Peptostreptococcales]|uniref:peroxide stress protein YaaA n=1 Tax=Peptostreptococcales TaxID=3082720 RepID=UPI000E4DB675|nr:MULTISPECIES: peroxide stress protein YaaA [Peptostreptococcaceae]MEE0248980.1 peroxide stress protein YaaA [Peptacetobacter hiranonis]QQQ86174.1 peroxide stress protein YaaA [Peptacetobacter hiranonis]RHQ95795.1 peroxide stress protein YaaA [Peptoclostridium sp. AF21-18]
MITIISPAKNMRKSEDWKELIDEGELSCPRLYEKSNEVLAHMKEYITEEIRAIMKIKEELAQLNYCRFQRMKPISCCKNSKDGKESPKFTGKTPAIFAYDGIQYKSISPESISKDGIEFLNDHLRIISGLYGVLRPFDMIDEYRLEMQTKVKINDKANLYSFWDGSISGNISEDLGGEGIVLNLASKEYSKTVEKYFDNKKSESKIKLITCTFKVEKAGKLKVESTASKKARGYMVRYIAENKIDDIEGVKTFNIDGFTYSENESTEKEIVFVKKVD